MEGKYSQQITIKCHECDPMRRLTLGGFLRRAQQISTDNCNEIGLDVSIYEKTNTAFLMARMAAVCHKAPVEGQRVTLSTVASLATRALYPRYTTIHDESGNLLIEASAKWVLVDTNTKRILRHYPTEYPNVFVMQDIPQLESTIEKTDIEFSLNKTATFMSCDENKHMNNTVYADLMYDALPIDLAMENEWKTFAITYHNEVALGESFDLQYGKIRGNSFYFCGNSLNKTHFQAQLSL